jgi:parvulin-like peptidyl-prolyl isomerase
LAGLFGPEFVARLAALPPGRWSGPVASSYGSHLVRVEARTEPEPVTLAQARATVLRDFHEEQRRTANRDVFERLKQRYQIAVDESAITNAPAKMAGRSETLALNFPPRGSRREGGSFSLA